MTTLLKFDDDYTRVWVNPDEIAAIEDDRVMTHIHMIGGRTFSGEYGGADAVVERLRAMAEEQTGG